MITLPDIQAAFDSRPDSGRQVLSLEGFAHAAVLIPLVAGANAVELLLTKRTEKVETHKGQISFPGGMADATDTNLIATALREADEEIGLPASHVEVVGLLDDMATPTGFVITPVVGVVGSLPALRLNADEVEEVFAVALDFFAHPDNGRSELREFRGRNHEVWYYQCGKHLVWGATAMIIRSLLYRLRMI
jgi:8-oxo-dGTP pyrophosphatase MutT (NUDIX family)